MSLIDVVSGVLKPLLKDESLKNVVFWKRVNQFINSLIVIAPVLAAIFPAYGVFLNKDFLLQLTGILGTLSVYFTTATTNKIGL